MLSSCLLCCSTKSVAHPGRGVTKSFLSAAQLFTGLHVLNIALQASNTLGRMVVPQIVSGGGGEWQRWSVLVVAAVVVVAVAVITIIVSDESLSSMLSCSPAGNIITLQVRQLCSQAPIRTHISLEFSHAVHAIPGTHGPTHLDVQAYCGGGPRGLRPQADSPSLSTRPTGCSLFFLSFCTGVRLGCRHPSWCECHTSTRATNLQAHCIPCR